MYEQSCLQKCGARFVSDCLTTRVAFTCIRTTQPASSLVKDFIDQTRRKIRASLDEAPLQFINVTRGRLDHNAAGGS